LTGAFVTTWYLMKAHTAPYTSLIPISGVMITLSFLLGVLALLADMLGRHRRISEELLYLARRKVYAGKKPRAVMATIEPARAVARLFEDSWDMEKPDAEQEAPLKVPAVTVTTSVPRATHVA